MFQKSIITSNKIVILRISDILETDKTTQKNTYQYQFNLAEIDAEHFPNHLFKRYAKEVFEEDHLPFE